MTTDDFVAGCRERACTPHVSQNNTNRRSAIDGRTTRHPGYRISTIKRKRIEEPFGWMKTIGVMRKTRHHSNGLCADCRRLQSRSHSKDPGCNGISLSGASKMQQSTPQNCAHGIHHGTSTRSLLSCTPRK
jgi:hypothetical protein